MDSFFQFSEQTNYIYSITNGTVSTPRAYTDTSPVILTPNCTNANFCLYYTSPRLKYGLVTSPTLYEDLHLLGY